MSGTEQTPPEDGAPGVTRDDPMIAAEWSLGLLEGEELLAARGKYATDPAFAWRKEWWDDWFAPLSDAMPGAEPGAHVWDGIAARIAAQLTGPLGRPLGIDGVAVLVVPPQLVEFVGFERRKLALCRRLGLLGRFP